MLLVQDQLVISNFPISPNLTDYQGWISKEFKDLYLKSMVASMSKMHASYSTILLVHSKHTLGVKGRRKPVGEAMIALIPFPWALEPPSNTIVHHDPSLGPSSGHGML